MLGEEIPDELIVERLAKIFKDLPPYSLCPVEEYFALRPPKMVTSRGRSLRVPSASSSHTDALFL
jgi:hypothetical protein